MSQIPCPGNPLCRKSFRYPSGLRGHRFSCKEAQRKLRPKFEIPAIHYHSPDVSESLIQFNRSDTLVTLISALESKAKSKLSSKKQLTESEKTRQNLAIRNNVNKGSVWISRQGAVNNFELKEYPDYQREYTTYWSLEELPQLKKIYPPRRDNVRLLLLHNNN